ncbi:MAG: hypothetical protein ACFB9M_09450 [Myxococcota bacterium]
MFSLHPMRVGLGLVVLTTGFAAEAHDPGFSVMDIFVTPGRIDVSASVGSTALNAGPKGASLMELRKGTEVVPISVARRDDVNDHPRISIRWDVDTRRSYVARVQLDKEAFGHRVAVRIWKQDRTLLSEHLLSHRHPTFEIPGVSSD